MRPRGLLISVAAATSLLLSPVAAYAQGPGSWVDVDDDDDVVDFGAEDGDDTTDTGEGGAAGQCTWSAVPEGEVGSLPWASAEEGQPVDDAGNPQPPEAFDWYWVSCPDGDGGETRELVPVTPDAAVVDVDQLREEAVGRLELLHPTVAMNPTGDQVVHVETWLWIDEGGWVPQSASVTAGGVTATVTATPRRVVWDLGNGDVLVCDGPGTAYDPGRGADEQSSDCAYAYAHSSAGQPGDAYQLTATVEWDVAWAVSGAAGGGALPAMSTSTSVPVRVAEMQALNQ